MQTAALLNCRIVWYAIYFQYMTFGSLYCVTQCRSRKNFAENYSFETKQYHTKGINILRIRLLDQNAVSICPSAGQDFQNTPCPAALVFSWFRADSDKKKNNFLVLCSSDHQDVAKNSLQFCNRSAVYAIIWRIWSCCGCLLGKIFKILCPTVLYFVHFTIRSICVQYPIPRVLLCSDHQEIVKYDLEFATLISTTARQTRHWM